MKSKISSLHLNKMHANVMQIHANCVDCYYYYTATQCKPYKSPAGCSFCKLTVYSKFCPGGNVNEHRRHSFLVFFFFLLLLLFHNLLGC